MKINKRVFLCTARDGMEKFWKINMHAARLFGRIEYVVKPMQYFLVAWGINLYL